MAFVILFYLTLPLVTAAAWWKGSRPEQSAGLLFTAALLVSTLLRGWGRARWHAFETGVFTVDLLLLISLLRLAARTGRRWLIWAAAFQTISVMAHFGPLTWPTARTLNYSYALMAGFSSWFTLVLLMAAVWRHPARHQAASTTSTVSSCSPAHGGPGQQRQP